VQAAAERGWTAYGVCLLHWHIPCAARQRLGALLFRFGDQRQCRPPRNAAGRHTEYGVLLGAVPASREAASLTQFGRNSHEFRYGLPEFTCVWNLKKIRKFMAWLDARALASIKIENRRQPVGLVDLPKGWQSAWSCMGGLA